MVRLWLNMLGTETTVLILITSSFWRKRTGSKNVKFVKSLRSLRMIEEFCRKPQHHLFFPFFGGKRKKLLHLLNQLVFGKRWLFWNSPTKRKHCTSFTSPESPLHFPQERRHFAAEMVYLMLKIFWVKTQYVHGNSYLSLWNSHWIWTLLFLGKE